MYHWRSINRCRAVAMAAIAGTVVACGAPSGLAPSPPTDHLGVYDLRLLARQPLPVVVMHQVNYHFRRVITSGDVTLSANGEYRVRIVWRDEDDSSGELVKQGVDMGTGTFVRFADSLRFRDERFASTSEPSELSPPVLWDGSVAGASLAAPVFGVVAAFERRP